MRLIRDLRTAGLCAQAMVVCVCVMVSGCERAEPHAVGGVNVTAESGSPSHDPIAGFVLHTHEHAGETYHYAVYRPLGLAADEPVPALLFLHGYGESGQNGTAPLAVGLPPAMMLEPERWPFVVIIPQKPTFNSEWEDHAGAVMAILDDAIGAHNVVPERVAITGLSQGGHGTLMLAAMHPDRFVAAAPVCGYIGRRFTPEGDLAVDETPPADDPAFVTLAERLRGIPVRLFHGDQDDVVPAAESVRIAAALNDVGADVEATIYPDANHNSWDKAYRESDVWDWLARGLSAD